VSSTFNASEAQQGANMRTSVTIDEETYTIVKEMAQSQGRTTANLLRHLIQTNNEVVGWKAFKRREAAK
jgi:predicted DNA-binding ribbon-helix-helix protein